MSIPPWYLENSGDDEQPEIPYDPCYSDEEFERARLLRRETTMDYSDEN